MPAEGAVVQHFETLPTRMPFGKYKGTPLVDLPDGYLEWLTGLDELYPPLSIAIMRELRDRWLGLLTEYKENWLKIKRLERQVDRLSRKAVR